MTQINPLPPEEMQENNLTEHSKINIERKRNARWGAIILTLVGIAFFIFAANVVSFTDPEDNILVGFPLVMAALGAVSIFLIQRDRIGIGSGIIFAVNLLLPVLLTFLVDNSFWAAFSYALLSSALLTWRTMPQSSWRWLSMVTSLALVLIIVINIIDSPNRLPNDPRTNIFITFVIVGLFLAVFYQVVSEAWQGTVASRLTISYILMAAVPLLIVGAIITFQSSSALQTEALGRQSQTAKRVAEQVETFILNQERELSSVNDLGFLDLLTTNELESVLLRLFTSNNLYNEIVLTNARGREIIFLSKFATITAEDLGSRAGTEAFEQAKATQETYFSDVAFNETTGEPFMEIGLPIIDLRTGDVQYVLLANFRFKPVWDIMANADLTGSGIVYMIEDDGTVIAHENASVVLQGTILNDPPEEDLFRPGLGGAEVAMARSDVILGAQDFDVIAEQPRDEAVALASRNLTTAIVSALVAIGLAIFVGNFISRLITTPLGSLAETAEQLATGKLSVRAEVQRADEIGSLATSFNDMAEQLQSTLEGLEERVATRTKDLATVANISTVTATIRDTQEMLTNMVHLTQRGFGLYHAHVFTFDKNEDMLAIVACGYREGDEHEGTHGTTTIPLGQEQSLVALCARTRQPVIVNDVRNEPGWLPNPQLPATRSELAVPMLVGDELLGVLDVQSEKLDAFTEEDANIQMTLASQIATALQNIQTYERTQKRAELESLVNVIGQRVQRSSSIEETLQIAIRELGTAIGAKRVKASIKPATESDGHLSTDQEL